MEQKKQKITKSKLPTGATPLGSEDLKGLIPRYITTRSELNDAEFINITKATNKYLLSVRKFKFTSENLFNLHKEMFGKIWRWAGEKRVTEKNIGVKFFKIDIEIYRFLNDLEFWLKNSMDLIEISVRIHHRLVFIHPFNNGNGRWARLAVNLFLIDHSNYFLNFPENELIISNKIRNTYIKALQKADKNNFSEMINFHKKYISDFPH